MRLKILDQKIPVRQRKEVSIDDADADGHITLGHFIPSRNEIELFVTEPQVKKAVLVHEIVEAIDFLCDLQLNHTQISTLGTAFNQLLVDNPALRKLYEK